jgi:hypothetical protein
MPLPNRCEVCGEPWEHPIDMCGPSLRSYVLNAEDRDDMAKMLWAARRARWYAERKAGRLARARKTTRAK